MQSAPLVLGISGLVLLGAEVWAAKANRRHFQARSRRQRVTFWACMSAVGILLAFVSLFAGYHLRSDVRVLGVPFLYAAWEFHEGKWLDFTGPLTLPALLGNSVVAFLLPQLIAAGAVVIRRRL